MQTLVEAAAHIAQEIERTRQHLVNLEQALDGLKPLITVDAATTTLTFAMSSPTQPIEDLSVVNAPMPAKKKAKAKLPVEPATEKVSPVKTKAVKVKAVKEETAMPTPVASPVKLPSTGAELWLKCIGSKKVTVIQITDAALKKLKLDESAKQVIATRAKAWVYAAAKKGDLIEAGMRDGSKLYQLAPTKEEIPAPSAPAVESAEAVTAVEVPLVAKAGEAA